MRFLRTASTGRLWASIGGVAAAIAACAAVAVAATSSGPVPKREPLAQAIHQALSAKSVSGITARITFANNLIDGSEIQGSDPLLQGGSGRMWLSSSSHLLRLEIQGDNGDAQVVVRGQSFWAYDPTSHTVYEGALPTSPSRSEAHRSGGVPSVAQISSTLKRLMQHAVLSGAIPGDIAGQPSYTVRISPRRHGGLLGAVELAWDAARGVPLRLSVFAKRDSTPVVDLAVTNIAYGRVAASAFSVSPPSGAKVVRLSSTPNAPSRGAPSGGAPSRGAPSEVTGVSAVQRALPFKLDAPARLAGMPRGEVKLVHIGTPPAALVTYGQGLGGVMVLEAVGGGHSMASSSSEGQGLTPPTVSINGTTGQELDTALGSVISFARNHVAYTVLGSVTPAVARAAARGL
jgi:outer membrane lipoprotein-sorting protein